MNYLLLNFILKRSNSEPPVMVLNVNLVNQESMEGHQTSQTWEINILHIYLLKFLISKDELIFLIEINLQMIGYCVLIE